MTTSPRPRACLLFATAVVACSRPAALPPAVVSFGADAIRVPEFAAELDRVRREARPWENAAEAVQLDPEQLRPLRRAVLDQLVERRLLLAEAAKAGVSVTDRELDEALRARARALDGEARRDPEAVEALRDRVREDLTLDRYLVREVAARVAVAPEDAQRWYEQHASEFRRPDQVRCSQLTVPTREEAAALKIQLNRGSDFARVAREQSTSVDRARGGDLGWFGRGQMPAEFEKACFSLRRGEVSDTVQSPYGFHLFKLVERREGSQIPFAEVEAQIDLRLRRERVAAAQAELVGKLRGQAGVQYDEAELDRVP